MRIAIRNAREHNLKHVDIELGDGVTAVTGVSGSGKSSLVFDTLYHEARRRFLDAFGTPGAVGSLSPPAVDAIEGLGPAVAVGQNLINRNPFSTVATSAGVHPFFRLLYARFGERFCPQCGTSHTTTTTDRIVSLIAEALRAEGSPLSVPLVRRAPGSHRTLLSMLAATHPVENIIVDGSPMKPKRRIDPVALHDIDIVVEKSVVADSVATGDESTAARAVLDLAESYGAGAISLGRNGCESRSYSYIPVCVTCGYWFSPLEPKRFSPRVDDPEAVATRCAGVGLAELLEYSVESLLEFLPSVTVDVDPRLVDEITRRLDALQRVGLGYVGLDRSITTLSRGEGQRLRIAIALVSPLEDMIHILDEPTIGQHPRDVSRFMPILHNLPGPTIFIEHDLDAICSADEVVDVGPGAGDAGGSIVFHGSPGELAAAETETGRAVRSVGRVEATAGGSADFHFASFSSVSLRNLKGIDIRFPVRGITAITGVSGSGKSTLMTAMFSSLQDGMPRGCGSFDSRGLKPVFVDQEPIGINPRSNPATYTKLSDALRDYFADATGQSRSMFTFNRPEGACPACNGMGAVEVTMRYLPSVWITCSDCNGSRFNDEARGVKVSIGGTDIAIHEVFDRSIDELSRLFVKTAEKANPSVGRIRRILGTLRRVGLGYLAAGQPSPTLSGGEAQRVKLARYMSRAKLSGTLFFLDEPSTGLHPTDVDRITDVLRELVRLGATIVLVEHNLDIVTRADWLIDLGPGAGPAGGELLYCGEPTGLSTCDAAKASATAEAVALHLKPFDHKTVESGDPRPTRSSRTDRGMISIRGARANSLRSVDVDIPKGTMTVVAGPSGSGKSSLVMDVLEIEARRRYLESLSLYERQGMRERGNSGVDSISGIGVTASFSTATYRYQPRDDVAKLTGLGLDIAVLLAEVGERKCRCGATMKRADAWICPECDFRRSLDLPEYFIPGTYASSCRTCHGVGSMQKPAPEKLVLHPELPLCAGALYSPGFFPKGYLCKPFNGGYYLVQALAERYDFEPDSTPWCDMSEEARQAFLFGNDEPIEVRYENKAGRVSVSTQRFPGFYGWVSEWDVGGTYTVAEDCPECGGARFRSEYLEVTLAGKSIGAMRAGSVSGLGNLSGLVLKKASRTAKAVLARVRRKLDFLGRVGLSYLTLNQSAHSLSAGESQRLRLSGLLGSELGSITVLLDEPTRGMHPAEIDGLVGALQSLRDDGNTVLLVEHDIKVIEAADHVLELGPGSGKEGGRIVALGKPSVIRKASTVTGAALRGEIDIRATGSPITPDTPRMTVRGARGNNLKGIDIDIPLGHIVGCCGVSGSGKSTLIVDTIARTLAPRKQTTSVAYEPVNPEPSDGIVGAPDTCIVIDQSRSGMSHPADFLGLETVFRRQYAESAEEAGYDGSVLKRDCTECGGSGIHRIDMGFLPSVQTECEACDGTGYGVVAREIRMRGLSLPELSMLTCGDALDLWDDEPLVRRKLQAAVDLGLGYLVLRQPAHALSGGEIQRLKIASNLSTRSSGSTLYILDEPTVGLHQADVAMLLRALESLRDAGHSVLLVEHNEYLLAACDWLIELGPVGGPLGGRLLFEGPPGEITDHATPTAPFISGVLK